MTVDLHTHSTASDGTDRPEALARLAKDAGLTAFALTDHDTTAGLAQAQAAARKLGVGFVPGIELSADPASLAYANAPSTTDENNGVPSADVPRIGTLHLLGYHIQHDDLGLAKISQQQREARAQRNPMIIAKLQEQGVRIEYEDVLRVAGSTDATEPTGQALASEPIVGRPHIAQVLLDKGYVRSIHEAFSRYIGVGGAAYARKDLLAAADAIQAIHAAGGVAVLAHPVQLRMASDDLEHAVAKLADIGLDGIETCHSDHEPGDIARFTALAEQFNMLATGGSDYHGSRKVVALGEVVAPEGALERLVQRAGR